MSNKAETQVCLDIHYSRFNQLWEQYKRLERETDTKTADQFIFREYNEIEAIPQTLSYNGEIIEETIEPMILCHKVTGSMIRNFNEDKRNGFMKDTKRALMMKFRAAIKYLRKGTK